MRELVVQAFVSLDGVMQAPGGPEEDPTDGFEYGGWSVAAWDEVMGETMDAATRDPFDLVLGRRTYEIFAAYWPYSGDPMGAKLTAATKYVASNTLQRPEWENTVVLRGDAPEKVRELKEADGPELQIHGSSALIRTLAAEGLVDEYRLWIFPVLLGRGKRIFGEDVAPSGLTLVDCTPSSTGVLMTRYRPSGPVAIGSFLLDEPTEAELRRREGLGL